LRAFAGQELLIDKSIIAHGSKEKSRDCRLAFPFGPTLVGQNVYETALPLTAILSPSLGAESFMIYE
jgi:hypothetical protein